MSKQILFSKKAKRKLKNGVDALANAVKVTLGAKGRNVAISEGYDVPHITKDGVTVARSISLADPVENMGVEIARQAATKVVNEAGDGTTTATILTQELVNRGIELLESNPNINPMDVKRGMELAVQYATNKLENLTINVKESSEKIKQIATISANNDEYIGSLIAEAMKRATINGVIKVIESNDTSTYIDIVEGLQFYKGFLSPYFINNTDKNIVEFENPLVLIYNDKVGHTNEILPIIKMAIDDNKPLLVLANDFEGEVITTLVRNKIQNGTRIVPVKNPFHGEHRDLALDDLAILLGGKVVMGNNGVEVKDFTTDMFGTTDRIEVNLESTIIIGGQGNKNKIDERVTEIQTQIENTHHEIDKDFLKKRLARLIGGVGVIYVGANSESELKEKKDRIDDALEATKSAVAEGIVAGGGVTLVEVGKNMIEDLRNKNKDQLKGIEIFQESLSSPMKQILVNAGYTKRKINKIIRNIRKSNYPTGYDVMSELYVNMIEDGIIDPKKVARVALEAAVSSASMVLITETTITDETR